MRDTDREPLVRRPRIGTAGKAALWGAVSVAIYVALFLNQDAATHHFTKGGVYALAIIVTALAFSTIHGSFASHMIDLSGIRPLQEEEED